MDHPNRPMASRSTPLDTLIRFLVWSAVIGTLAIPVLLIALFNSQILVSFPFLRESPPRATAAATPRAQQIERLRSFTARPEQVAGAITRLNILAIAFDGEKPQPVKDASASPGHAVDPDGYRRLSLDLTGLPRDGVVVIADQPIRWVVSGVTGSWGRIGFEGLAPFDIVGGRPGLLAGFRIRAFGARTVARATDPGRLESQARYDWCNAVRLWSDHFAIPAGQVEFGVIGNPTSISARNGTIASDGAWGVVRGGSGIMDFCKRYPR